MICNETFESLRSHATSSWAIWSSVGDNSVGFFRDRIQDLHGRAIFVGLNRSSSWTHDLIDRMSNFHAKGHVGDSRLKRQIQDSNRFGLIGGFMTDLSEEIETDSGKVKLSAAETVAVFKNKIIGIDENSHREIICFGDKVFDGFRKGLGVKSWAVSERDPEMKCFSRTVGEENWRFHRVWHYSNYGKLLAKAEEVLPKQLQVINDLMEAEPE